MFWYRALAVIVLGTAVLLFRGGHGDSGEVQDARGEIDASAADDATPLVPLVAPALARPDVTRLALEAPRSIFGHLFVSEIFRPPIAPLSLASL